VVGKTMSHYRVLEVLVPLGMGVVYRAKDEQLDRDVALNSFETLRSRSSPWTGCSRRVALLYKGKQYRDNETE
jgi:hypothetical protein